MESKSLHLVVLVILAATATCNTSKWHKKPHFEITENEKTNFDEDDDCETDSKDVRQTKNLMSKVLDEILQTVFSNDTSFQVPLIPLGPGNGVLQNVQIQTKCAIPSPVEGSGSFSIAKLEITFGKVSLSGVYNRSIILPGLEVDQKGDFSIELFGLQLSTGVTILMNVSNLVVTDLPDFNLSLKNSKIWFENLVAGQPLGDAQNAILGYGLPAFIANDGETFISEHIDEIAAFLNPLINCIKNHITDPMTCIQKP